MKIVLTEVPFTKDRDMSVEKSCLPEGAELVVAVYDEHAEDNSEFYKLIEDADIIVNSYVYFGKKEIDTLKKCKVISFQSTGYNEVDRRERFRHDALPAARNPYLRPQRAGG